MYSCVAGKFRVESGSHDLSFANGYGIVALGCDYFDSGPHAFDLGCADEYHFDRTLLQVLLDKSAFTNGTVELTTVSVAADADVNRTEARLLWVFYVGRQQNRARASPKRGLRGDEVFQLFESSFAQQLEKRSRLAAGDDQAVDVIQLLGPFDEHNFSAQFFEPSAMGIEVTL